MIPGNGIGGVVSAVGEGADTGLIGSQVVTSTGGSGGYAQRVAVEASALFEVPEGLALDAAVALLADGRTATGLVRAAAIKPGERVLVEAAAGGVGSLLVQLAKAAGAEVIGAVAVPARPSWCASLGRTWLSTTGSQTGLSASAARSTSCSTASAATPPRLRSNCSAVAAVWSSSGSPAAPGPKSRTTTRRHAG
jgi:NADPH:quinone reductase-like Zn-dependent oxidoreductase